MQTRPARLLSIQALRGVAAFLVLIYHISIKYDYQIGEFQGQSFGRFWTQSYAGVDMFFVISGFIMVYVTAEIIPSLQSCLQFLRARVIRIYPLWWFVSIVMMAYFWVSYDQVAAPDRAVGIQVLPYTIKSWFLWPQATVPVIGIGWTLIHEMLFYAVFALGLLCSRKLLPIWLVIWALIIAVASFFHTPLSYAENMLQLIVSPLNIEFILGGFAAMWFLKGNNKLDFVFLGLGALGFIAALMIGIFGDEGIFLWKRVLVFGLPCAAIVLGAALLERRGKLKVPEFMVILGDWSYSLYLTHFIVIVAVIRIWEDLDKFLPDSFKIGSESKIDNMIFIGLSLSLSILVAAMTYRLIERPMMKLLRRT